MTTCAFSSRCFSALNPVNPTYKLRDTRNPKAKQGARGAAPAEPRGAGRVSPRWPMWTRGAGRGRSGGAAAQQLQTLRWGCAQRQPRAPRGSAVPGHGGTGSPVPAPRCPCAPRCPTPAPLPLQPLLPHTGPAAPAPLAAPHQPRCPTLALLLGQHPRGHGGCREALSKLYFSFPLK